MRPVTIDKRGLPSSVETERLVLGSILLDDTQFPEALTVDAFILERHRRVWRRMCDLRVRGEGIDRVTLYNELQRHGEAEADSLAFILSLDEGLPQLPKLDTYVRILQEHAHRRRIIFACEHLKNRAGLRSENLAEIIEAGQELFTSTAAAGQAYQSIEDIPCIADCGATGIDYIRDPELPRGAVVAVTGDAGCGKSTLVTAFAREAWRSKGVPSLFLDRENPIGVIADRLERLGMEDGPGARFWGGWLPEQAPQPDNTIVRAWAKEQRGLVVVDSFSAFLEGDQNDAAIVRAFMHRCRRLADLGATVVVIHHDGKAETARDYRGSSDFKAAIDIGFHVTNFGDGTLDKLLLRPFKTRFGAAGAINYDYAGGRFVRGDEREARQTVTEQLTVLLRLNPGVTARKFDDLVKARGIGRDRGRTFFADGLCSGLIRRETGPNNEKHYYLAE